MIIKRVTLRVELVDDTTGLTVWEIQEVVQRGTGDNPRWHVVDATIAADAAVRNVMDVIGHRFGAPPD